MNCFFYHESEFKIKNKNVSGGGVGAGWGWYAMHHSQRLKVKSFLCITKNEMICHNQT